MKTVAEFRAQAEHCRMLAKRAHTRGERDKYLVMADAWEGLATERERRLKLTGEEDVPDQVACPTASH